MEPRPPLKPKRSFGSHLRQGWNKVFRQPSSSSAPQQSSLPSSSQPVAPLPSSHTTPRTEASLVRGSSYRTADEWQESVRAPPLVQSASTSTPTPVDPRKEAIAAVTSSAANRSTSTGGSLFASGDPGLHTSLHSTSGVWAGLGTALRALHESAQLFPPLQSAIRTLIPCLDVLADIAKDRQEYQELASELTSLTRLLVQHMSNSNSARMSDSIANVARSIEEQARLIEKKRGRGTGRRLIEASRDEEEFSRCYRRISSLFRQLQTDVNLSMWNIVNDQMAHIRLKELAPVKLAYHDSMLSAGIARRTCTPNTRTAILCELNGWSKDPDAADLYWMNGMAGTGKTTIACSFSESLEKRKQLAASFFCARTVPECREATRIIPTIAYQLARYSVPFKSVLCEVLGEDPDVGSKNMTKQFERLLKEPLLKVKGALPDDLVVVIDALDECSDLREVELLLSILLKSASDLPLKFFVTSRPEPEVYRRMAARASGSRATLHLHEIEKSLVQADIEVYLTEELEFMSPAPDQVKELARRSGNLFIYAATLVRCIRSRKPQTDPQRRLRSVLDMTFDSTKQHATIDALYAAVLKTAFDDDLGDLEAEEVEDVRRVLQTVVCVQEPVSIEVLAVMTGVDDERRVLAALQPLLSVLHFSETSGLVSTLHASFSDFMFDEARSKAFSCNLAEHNQLLARRCFNLMQEQLRFNICELESSFVPDNKVDNLEERIKLAISPVLSYACRYWSNHLRYSVYSSQLRDMLGAFLAVKLLFWMEVLSLKREINLGVEALLRANLWLKTGSAPPYIIKLTEDARNFVTRFAANPVSQSTPHIYISLLPFCSRSSSIFNLYWEKTRGLINVTGGAMQKRDVAALTSWTIDSRVFSLAYSPNGSCVAAGCDDGTVSVRSAQDGSLVAGPVQGCIEPVLSVAYSPDSTSIASGCGDCTIRVWSASDGKLIAGPFEGHSDSVESVAYSPDGMHIVSGSYDRTLRIWRAHDGMLIAGPLLGHTDSVWSVAYSPDGTHVASGSWDCTVRVWSARHGTLVAGPFEGHTHPVYSIAYSPNGNHIVSGSSDRTIRVWSPHDGTLVAGPFEGHTNAVLSVAYSPDGTCIVSGSADRTIRVWSAHDGTLVAGPFEGHNDSVWLVRYSPDGTCIVSGSDDRSLQVWNVHDGTLVTGPFEGHSGWILSVAYSPNGLHIVSGSKDRTIRVWNAHDGTLVAGPLKGHAYPVHSVVYSPDGAHIVSGSTDGTILAWSVHDGTLAASSFKGHTGRVCSMAYSPDGTRIVSGSGDHTIRVWSAHAGTLVVGPLEGHSDWVLSVAYSPDGTRIVSGSKDHTILVWNAHDGTLAIGPFEGCPEAVLSVAYSPDGTRIASGLNDHSIRVWDADRGILAAHPFKGHTGPVWSVSYSPDGTRIVSSSNDCTIRVWNSHDGTPVAGPFEGHAGPVRSVRYSPDGTRIISGSHDHTIRVWSVHLGSRSMPTACMRSPVNISGDVSDNVALPRPPGPSSTTHDANIPSASRAPDLDHWSIRNDGWVVNTHSQLLFWMPPEFARARILPTISTPLIIGPRGSLRIDYDNVFIGEDWHKAYKLN